MGLLGNFATARSGDTGASAAQTGEGRGGKFAGLDELAAGIVGNAEGAVNAGGDIDELEDFAAFVSSA